MESPTLPELLQAIGRKWSEQLRVCVPGRVVSYDAAKQTAAVQVLQRDEYTDEDGQRQVESIPVLYGVPVVWPRSGKAFFVCELERDDSVLLIFTDRSIDQWQTSGGEYDPTGNRHDLGGCFAIPGPYPVGGVLPVGSLAPSGGLRLGVNGGSNVAIANDVVVNGGSKLVARKGDKTIGHTHTITSTAGPYPIVATLTIETDTINEGAPNFRA